MGEYHAAMQRTFFGATSRAATLAALTFGAAQALARDPAPAPPAPGNSGLWGLFSQSFDIFTVLLILGSVVALAVVFSCMMDIRQGRILPRRSIDQITDLSSRERWDELREFTARDDSFVGHVLRAALRSARVSDPEGSRDGVRESAELAAAEESARWFRRIELLNVIGNLGPLIGLAGTVWGMILAFTSLGESGGQAGPSDLSLGISKALFHTLLGLMLAIPCLLVFGIYRSIVDRWCTRGTVIAGQIVDRIPLGPTVAVHPNAPAEPRRAAALGKAG